MRTQTERGSVPCDQCVTSRELEVLSLAASGLTILQIAASLSLSPHTVVSHLASLRRRAAARNGYELIARAYAAGVLLQGIWPPRTSGQRCLRIEVQPSRSVPVGVTEDQGVGLRPGSPARVAEALAPGAAG